MSEFIEMFLNKTNNPAEQTKWLFKGFPFNDNLNQEIQSAVIDMKYHNFLETTYWKTIAMIVKDESNNKCSKCGSDQNLEVHHTTYENHGLEHLKEVQNNDLVCLCHKCHSELHNIDNLETFIFYESWLDFIKVMEDVRGRGFANELCRQICEFGITNKIESDDMIVVGLIKSMVAPLVESSKKKYKKSKMAKNKS